MQWHLGHHTFTFATTRELRDCLLVGSLVDAAYTGGPLLMVGPDAVPAWRWLGEVARLRSDWRESAGIALQHAAAEGGALAQRALADLVANDRFTTLLLPWTEPLVPRFGAARATQATTGLGGGQITPTFAEVMRDQRALWDLVTQPDREVLLEGRRRPIPLRSPADLAALLTRTASDSHGMGAWAWLHQELVFRPWVAEVVPDLLGAWLLRGEGEVVAAALRWLLDGWDPWRFCAPLEALVKAQAHPPWWEQPLRPGRQRCGAVVQRLWDQAREAQASPPRLDLAPMGPP